jgi:DNA-binding transcriptional MocR family regulator
VKAFLERKPDDGARWLLRFAVAGWIALHARTDATRAVISVRALAFGSDMNERSVRRALDEIKAEGWLTVRERGHYRHGQGPTATVYDLDIPEALQDTYGWPVELGALPDTEQGSTGHGHAQNVDPQVLPTEVLPQGGRAAGAAPAPHNFEPGVGDLCRCGLPERNQRHKVKSAAAKGTRS